MINKVQQSSTNVSLQTSGGGDRPDPPNLKETTVNTDTVTLSEEAIVASTETSGGGDRPDPPN